MRILEYTDAGGNSPFQTWFDDLDSRASAKVVVALTRIEQGNLSNVKAIGHGVLEYKVDFGPGYRIYFGRIGNDLIILLGGGTKNRQQGDITAALSRWQDYKKRMRH